MAADQQRFREVMGHFATGVAIVACAGDDGPSGLTTSSVASVRSAAHTDPWCTQWAATQTKP